MRSRAECSLQFGAAKLARASQVCCLISLNQLLSREVPCALSHYTAMPDPGIGALCKHTQSYMRLRCDVRTILGACCMAGFHGSSAHPAALLQFPCLACLCSVCRPPVGHIKQQPKARTKQQDQGGTQIKVGHAALKPCMRQARRERLMHRCGKHACPVTTMYMSHHSCATRAQQNMHNEHVRSSVFSCTAVGTVRTRLWLGVQLCMP